MCHTMAEQLGASCCSQEVGRSCSNSAWVLVPADIHAGSFHPDDRKMLVIPALQTSVEMVETDTQPSARLWAYCDEYGVCVVWGVQHFLKIRCLSGSWVPKIVSPDITCNLDIHSPGNQTLKVLASDVCN